MEAKILCIGYFTNKDFCKSCQPYLSAIKEVYFGWPGVLTCRSIEKGDKLDEQQLVKDLRWCREQGLLLDLLFNCNCYGDTAISASFAAEIHSVLGKLKVLGLSPDIVTTTSPFVAFVLRESAPSIRIRGSVNMRVHGTIGFEPLLPLFDEFYASRERQRDFSYMRHLRQWSQQHHVSVGMQANSGCLRQCPYQSFHDNLHGHHREKQMIAGKELGFELFCCKENYLVHHRYSDVLRSTWIRPEDIHLWKPFVDFIKLSTRRVPSPARIIQAYATENYSGNLLELLDPDLSHWCQGTVVYNHRFPQEWPLSGIGGKCADNCTHCGACERVWDEVTQTT